MEDEKTRSNEDIYDDWKDFIKKRSKQSNQREENE